MAKRRALAGVSFQVQAGELFGLLGPNGAGKTTLLSIVSCLLEADGRRGPHPGTEGFDQRPRSCAALIGIVPQELAIYGELNARENLDFFGGCTALRRARSTRRVDEVLAASGLTDRADDACETFSGGMKRRLNLGAAIVHQPKLLLLDEPTTGVDPAVAQSHLRGSPPAGRPGRERRLHQPLHGGGAGPVLARRHHRPRPADRLRHACRRCCTRWRADPLSRAAARRTCASGCGRFPARELNGSTGPAGAGMPRREDRADAADRPARTS